MRKKINLQLLVVTAIAIFSTLALVITVFYEIFQHEIFEELSNDAGIIMDSQLSEKGNMDQLTLNLKNLRVTIIDETGKVVFDNEADAATMKNHSKRQEVLEAVRTGEGKAIRKSETLGSNIFYYAVRQDNGMILRVAKNADSMWNIFRKAVPPIAVIVVCLFSLCIILAHQLTKSLVIPIEQIAQNMEKSGNISPYKELVPFITTIQKQHEDIIRGAKMRQEFTANVSHELKTPLTSISGYAELIENGMAGEADVKRFAEEIHRNSNRLLNLINDIIKLSELDATDIEVNFETVDLFEIVRDTVDMLALSADKHKIDMKLTGETCMIRGNKSMLEEVAYNLCDNAIRYNNPGGTVKVSVKAEKTKAVLTVTDNGIGISKKNQERVFERFYRVDKSRSKSTGGTGLGLAIVKHIVAQHKAELTIESEVGKGTEIRVSFQIV